MMGYKENPKTKGSGIICAIPQTGLCPHRCPDCFFRGGRSYLEPLEENLPNMPSLPQVVGRVVRVNDGNDSNVDRELVLRSTEQYPECFYNTASPCNLGGYGAPVVLTINPGEKTDRCFYYLEEDKVPPNLMFVRMRTNAWNRCQVDLAVAYYTQLRVPVVLTFMAYFHETVPRHWRRSYPFRKRTLNSYWAITTKAWRRIMARYQDNPLVYSCGVIEEEKGTTLCRHCGNCLREYYAAQERLRKGD